MSSSSINSENAQSALLDVLLRILADLQCDGSVKERAIKVLDQAVRKQIVSSKGISGQAAGIAYISSILAGKRLTQEAIGNAAGLSSRAVGRNYIRIARGLGYGEF